MWLQLGVAKAVARAAGRVSGQASVLVSALVLDLAAVPAAAIAVKEEVVLVLPIQRERSCRSQHGWLLLLLLLHRKRLRWAAAGVLAALTVVAMAPVRPRANLQQHLFARLVEHDQVQAA